MPDYTVLRFSFKLGVVVESVAYFGGQFVECFLDSATGNVAVFDVEAGNAGDTADLVIADGKVAGGDGAAKIGVVGDGRELGQAIKSWCAPS